MDLNEPPIVPPVRNTPGTSSMPPPSDPWVTWTRFLNALSRLLLAAPPGAVGSFTDWRNHLFTTVASEEAIAAVAAEFRRQLGRDDTAIGASLLLEELQAFIDYVERITGGTVEYEPLQPLEFAPAIPVLDTRVAHEGLGIAETVLESVRDLLDKLPFKWKAVLRGVQEAIAIWKEATG